MSNQFLFEKDLAAKKTPAAVAAKAEYEKLRNRHSSK